MSDPSKPHRPDYHSLKSAEVPPIEVAVETQQAENTKERELERYRAELDRKDDLDIINLGIKARHEDLERKGYGPNEIINEHVKAGQTETVEDVKKRLLKEMEQNLQPPPPENDPNRSQSRGR